MNGQYQPGDTVFGSWTLTRLLGEGSYGRVYEAEREDFGRVYKAAVKIITIPQTQGEVDSIMADSMDEESVTAYFKGFVGELVDEVALMSKLKGNSNIVSYEDHTVVQHTGRIGWNILVRMELLTPLHSYLAKQSFTRHDVIKFGIDMCRALELCQKYNIIHRDIKPENIFVSENGDFKLGDFGIARTVEKTTSGLSKKGTYTYMAPEIYRGEAYGSNVDIYSLGIVLYRMINENRAPFMPDYPKPITHSDRESALVKRISGAELPIPKSGGGRLTEIILKACAYSNKERYSSPMQMREELEAILYDQKDSKMIYPQGDHVPIKSIEYANSGSRPREQTAFVGVNSSVSDSNSCYKCGALTTAGMDFCVNCGAKTSWRPQHAQQEWTPRPTQQEHLTQPPLSIQPARTHQSAQPPQTQYQQAPPQQIQPMQSAQHNQPQHPNQQRPQQHNAPPELPDNQPNQPKKKMLIPIIACCAAFVVVVTTVILILVLGKNSDSKNKNNGKTNIGEVNPTPTPTPRPTPTPSPSSKNSIPGDGGEVRVSGATEFSFIPDNTGLWVIYTSESEGFDPYLELYDARGNLIAEDDDTGETDAMIMNDLQAGTSYKINVWFIEDGGSGECLLSVGYIDESYIGTIPSSGGAVFVEDASVYRFKPEISGLWEFLTSDNDECDPAMVIFNAHGNCVGNDDDGGDDGNAYIAVELYSGDTYIIAAGFNEESGSCLLTVTYLNGSAIASTGVIAGDGGTYKVNEATVFEFTPKDTNMWQIHTSDNGDCDPYLVVYNSDGEVVAEDDDGTGSSNAMLAIFAMGGETYYITAGYYGEADGSYSLNVAPCEFILGSDKKRVTEGTIFVFVPEQSGEWEFRTSDNGDCDPAVLITDFEGNIIAEDDDSGDNGNAIITEYFSSEMVYYVHVSFFYNEDVQGSFDLNVRKV